MDSTVSLPSKSTHQEGSSLMKDDIQEYIYNSVTPDAIVLTTENNKPTVLDLA